MTRESHDEWKHIWMIECCTSELCDVSDEGEMPPMKMMLVVKDRCTWYYQFIAFYHKKFQSYYYNES